jgi:multiple sugar transport system permease protein
MTTTPPAPRDWTGLAFVAPFLACYLVLLVWPVIDGVWLGFHAIDLLSNIGRFVGWRNYVDLAADEAFMRVVFNTLVFAALCTPLVVAMGLTLALALNRPGRPAALLRGLFFGASVLSVTIVTLVWKLVLMPERGLVANAATAVGLDYATPLNSTVLALPTVALVTMWWVVGLPLMLFLAALQQVPQDIYEAAALDNTSRWRSFRFITLPAIRRTVVLVAITQLIGQLQVFGQIQLLTQGGPNNGTRPLVMFIFEALFDQWALGYAAAAAQVLFVLLLAGVSIQQVMERRWRLQDERAAAAVAPGAAR